MEICLKDFLEVGVGVALGVGITFAYNKITNTDKQGDVSQTGNKVGGDLIGRDKKG